MDIYKVTVVPKDKLLVVNGQALWFDYKVLDGIHAIQWDGIEKAGHIEYTDRNHANFKFEEDKYEEIVAPFVAAWEAEKERLEAEAKAAEEARIAEYNSEEARWGRLRMYRDAKLNATDFYIMPDYPIDADTLAKVQAYRQALRDLPTQDGAPWNDGTIPWPVLDI